MHQNVESHESKRQAFVNAPSSWAANSAFHISPGCGHQDGFCRWNVGGVECCHIFPGWNSAWKKKKNIPTAWQHARSCLLIRPCVLFICLWRQSHTYCCLLVGNDCRRCQSSPEQVLLSRRHQGRLSQQVPAAPRTSPQRICRCLTCCLLQLCDGGRRKKTKKYEKKM